MKIYVLCFALLVAAPAVAIGQDEPQPASACQPWDNLPETAPYLVRCFSGGKIISQVSGEKYNPRLRRLRQRDGMEFYFGDNCIVYRFPRD